MLKTKNKISLRNQPDRALDSLSTYPYRFISDRRLENTLYRTGNIHNKLISGHLVSLASTGYFASDKSHWPVNAALIIAGAIRDQRKITGIDSKPEGYYSPVTNLLVLDAEFVPSRNVHHDSYFKKICDLKWKANDPYHIERLTKDFKAL
jgi:hypothetical protein